MRPRLIKTIASLFFTILLVVALAVPLGPLPALGPLLSPVGGLWSAARDGNFRAEERVGFVGVAETVEVVRDKYGVPHIFCGDYPHLGCSPSESPRTARAPKGCFAKDAGLEHLWVITAHLLN